MTEWHVFLALNTAGIRYSIKRDLDLKHVREDKIFLFSVSLVLMCIFVSPSFAEQGNDTRPLFHFEFQFGPAWQAKNEVSAPSSTGTKIDLTEGFDNPATMFGRANLEFFLGHRHNVLLWIAPSEFRRHGSFDAAVSFAGQTFAANTPTNYQYRTTDLGLRYHYEFIRSDSWNVKAGFSLAYFDLKVTLEQQGIPAASERITSLVPLATIAAAYNFTPSWKISLETEGGAVSSNDWSFFGRALLHYRINDLWDVSAGYLNVSYAFDESELKNSAIFHSLVFNVGYSFY